MVYRVAVIRFNHQKSASNLIRLLCSCWNEYSVCRIPTPNITVQINEMKYDDVGTNAYMYGNNWSIF